jgi:seryl-tRNA synthetase
VGEAQRLDARLREITGERDGIRARINELSKEVGRLRREGDVGAAEALQAREPGARRRPRRSWPPSTTTCRRRCATCCS